MKNAFLKTAQMLLFSFAVLTAINAGAHNPSGKNALPKLNLTVTIPDALQSQITRQDFENESIFSFKNGNNEPAFLFSITKVTDRQWATVKGQIKKYLIIENKDGFITFVQRTDQPKIKGSANAQYHQVLQQVDAMITTIQLN